MLDYDSALARVLTDVPLLTTERMPPDDAIGRVLRAALMATCPIPRFDSSAMDGYAVRAQDCGSSVELPVAGEARTGRESQPLEPHTAMRIFTGAALPKGADSVVMQEKVLRHDQSITLQTTVRLGENVRRAGEDLMQGQEALRPGSRLTAGAAMLAASLDQTEVEVASRPRVTILCTGDELRSPGVFNGQSMIPESNSPGLRALARQAGAEVVIAPLLADEPRILEHAIATALQRSDVVVTIGGVSVGDHDHVRSAMLNCGVAFDFWKVAIKPGKPLAFGRRDACRVLALPGNPASAAITFALFAVPLLRALQGDSRPQSIAGSVLCDQPIRRNKDRLVLSLGQVTTRQASCWFAPHAHQSSGATLALAQSDGVAFIAAGEGVCEPGAPIPFLFWSLL